MKATPTEFLNVIGLLDLASIQQMQLGDNRSQEEISEEILSRGNVRSLRPEIQRLTAIVAENEDELKARAVVDDDCA